jgi:hypothetical protein
MQRQQLARQLGLLATPVSDAAIPSIEEGGRYELNVGSGFTPVSTTTPVTNAPIMTADLSSDYSNEGRTTLPATYAGGFAPVAAPVVAVPQTYSEFVGGPAPVVSPDVSWNEFTGYGGGGGGGGGYTGGYQTSGEFRGMPSSFGGIGASAYAKGGPVSMNRLQGPNPAGPDDGYATLKSGEFVINDKAVKKYGIELMNAINSGKISKGKLRGLLEM